MADQRLRNEEASIDFSGAGRSVDPSSVSNQRPLVKNEKRRVGSPKSPSRRAPTLGLCRRFRVTFSVTLSAENKRAGRAFLYRIGGNPPPFHHSGERTG